MGAIHDQVSFLLNGVRHDVPRSVPPTRTLLDYLREDCGLKGTKEGCNEGDCGACTVVVASLRGNTVEHLAVNACIQLVPMVDGKSVLTIDGLRGPRGEPHPVQQAMVDCHGSQCGFCTPGFVMSIYAQGRGSPGHAATIDDALAGNLCRCTGYGPIVAAAAKVSSYPRPGWDEKRRNEEREFLEDQSGSTRLALDHPNGRFFAPTNLSELIQLTTQYPEVHILAGATDVGLWVTKQLRGLPVLISIDRVMGLRGKQSSQSRPRITRIGAAETYSEAYGSLGWYYPDIWELVRRVGSVQVRNSGTICGNIANGSPIGDMPPALIALDATLVLNGPQGQRRMPLEDFFVAYGKQDRKPGEFVEAVEVPLTEIAINQGDEEEGDARPRFYKISKRFDQDISAVLGCFNLAIETGTVASARIAFGGMAPIPKRAKAVEAALVGKSWTMATVEAALPAFEADFQPISDMRASAEYRMRVAKNLLVRYFHETTSDVPTRLVGRGHDGQLRPDESLAMD